MDDKYPNKIAFDVDVEKIKSNEFYLKKRGEK